MTSAVEVGIDRSVVYRRAFVRTSPDGAIDGQQDRGLHAEGVRLLRRIEVHCGEPDVAVPSSVALGEQDCVVRFELPTLRPGAGVLLVVEVDGSDPGAPVEPVPSSSWGDARPSAQVLLEAHVTGAHLVGRDGVALADGPISADGTARTASWEWAVVDDGGDATIELRVAWSLSSDRRPVPARAFAEVDRDRRATRGAWLAERPVLAGAAGRDLDATVRAALEDLADLRLPTPDGPVLAAGVPSGLTVVGRDALLAAWMALPVDPELAKATLRHLARHQATSYDRPVDAEPGKVQHDERHGVAALHWHDRYYGSVDSTPLFAMLFAETCRWTGDQQFARELEQPARRAIDWIRARIEDDEFGLVGYRRVSEHGLDVQSWKGTPEAQRDHVGRVATGSLRPIEAQGYAVAALRSVARIATSAWGDEVIASEWAADARLLERAMLDRHRVELPPSHLLGDDDPRRGGFLAHGVDEGGLPLDALCSNAGHLLWADAVSDPSLRSRLLDQLCHPALESGWGIRTMSVLDVGFDPASAHCGSVWPHDTAICVAGIARYDREVAARVASDLFDAAAGCGGRLPSHFNGAERRSHEDAPEPIATANSPHACAAGASLLLLRALLGLEPDSPGTALTTNVREAPAWLAGIRWNGIHALGRRWDVEVGRDCAIDVTRAT